MPARLHALANPARFTRLARALTPWTLGGATALLAFGTVWFLVFAPADYQQGESVRIMYAHVPSAWLAMMAYVVMAAASAAALIWRHPLGHVLARAAAAPGAVFTALALLTGSLWGKPMWGTWWVWDGRLTSVLVLLFLYLGHIALSHAFDEPARGARAAAVLAIVGVVNLPIIKFSVDWWQTLHQPSSVLKLGGPTIHAALLWPLLVMILAFTLYFVAVWLMLARRELAAARLRALRLAAVQD
jgi:heme exporter protein C